MSLISSEQSDFFSFLLKKTFESQKVNFDEDVLNQGFNKTVNDVKYHYPNIDETLVWKRIISNSNELAIWLYRIGRFYWTNDNSNPILNNIHWLLKDLCACEIYFSTSIDIGFYIFHGEGVVVGSRNVIGKGLRIYQNVTIGHKIINSNGVIIGDNVRIYAGAKIIGNITIGNNVIVGANTVITKSVESNKIIYGNPNIIKSLNNRSNLI